MFKNLSTAALVGGMSLVVSLSAQALPLAPSPVSVIEDSITLVRDGCGPGMRFSNRRGACVPDYGGPRYYGGGGPQYYDGRPRRRNNDAAVAVGTAAAVLGIIASSNRGNRNRNFRRHH